jgi:regulator of sigma E protease
VLLGIIVFVHEGGHFLAARLMGARVKEFMFGLPGPSIGFTFRGTRYGVTAIPLGGYALIAGEGGEENPDLAKAYACLAYFGKVFSHDAERMSQSLGFDLLAALESLESWMTVKVFKDKGRAVYYEMPEATVDGRHYAQGEPRPVSASEAEAHIDAERSHTFNGKPWWRRVVILLAGSIMNLFFAMVVFTAALMFVGVSAPSTTIDTVVEDTPAALAGLEPGDKILAIDQVAFASWDELLQGVASHEVGETVTLEFERRGLVRQASVTFAANASGGPMIGITPHPEGVKLSFTDAAATSVGLIPMVTEAILKLFNPATAGETISQSTSIVGVAYEARNAVLSGFPAFIVLAAALSVSIGILNLLPLPPLDGGKIVIETIQRVTRRIIPVRIVNGISLTCLVLMGILFVVLTNQDIQRYIIGG